MAVLWQDLNSVTAVKTLKSSKPQIFTWRDQLASPALGGYHFCQHNLLNKPLLPSVMEFFLIYEILMYPSIFSWIFHSVLILPISLPIPLRLDYYDFIFGKLYPPSYFFIFHACICCSHVITLPLQLKVVLSVFKRERTTIGIIIRIAWHLYMSSRKSGFSCNAKHSYLRKYLFRSCLGCFSKIFIVLFTRVCAHQSVPKQKPSL